VSTADPQPVHLQVKLFGHLRKSNQPSELALAVPAGTSVQAVLWKLSEMLGADFQQAIFDSAGNLHGGIEVVLNETHLPARKISTLRVHADGSLYLIPMIEGG
jgi:hypothetical protein